MASRATRDFTGYRTTSDRCLALSARLTLTTLRTILILAWENTPQAPVSDGVPRAILDISDEMRYSGPEKGVSSAITRDRSGFTNILILICQTISSHAQLCSHTFLMLLSPHWWFVVWPWEHVLITTLLRLSNSFEILLISQPLVTFFSYIEGLRRTFPTCAAQKLHLLSPGQTYAVLGNLQFHRFVGRLLEI